MKKTMLLASVCAALLQACAPVSTPGEGSSTMPRSSSTAAANALSLPAYYWRLVSATDASGKSIPALQKGVEQPLRLSFTADAMNVRGGCNAQFGGYTYKDGVLHVANLAATMKACEPALMQLDAAIGQLLDGMRRIGLSKDYTTVLATHHKDEFGELYRGFNAMLREIRVRDEKLSQLATTDTLTGLANRGHALESLQTMLTRAQRLGRPIGVMLLDVAHFKQVNDTHGHPAGDQVLRDIAHILQANVRAYDLAARFGGEEFLVLCEGADLPATADMAERIRTAVASHVCRLADGQTLHTTVSVGVYAGAGPHATAMQLIEWADQALYRAKQAGRNRVEHA